MKISVLKSILFGMFASFSAGALALGTQIASVVPVKCTNARGGQLIFFVPHIDAEKANLKAIGVKNENTVFIVEKPKGFMYSGIADTSGGYNVTYTDMFGVEVKLKMAGGKATLEGYQCVTDPESEIF